MTDPTPSKQPPARRWPFLLLAAAAFAALVTLGPVIATSRIDAGGSQNLYAAGEAGMLAAREAAAQDSVRAIATTAEVSPQLPTEAPPTTEAPPDPVASVEVSPAMPVVAPIATPDPPVDGGAIELLLAQADREHGLEDGGTATWEITLSNTGDEYLWGVYAYLEGHGVVRCDQRQLAAGASTVCMADQVVWAGEQSAAAWATAWTAHRMVEAEASMTFLVGG